MVGSTGFANAFIPLFKAHPLVRGVVVCDLVPEKREAAARHGVGETSPSLDALLESDVDAVAIITQNWLHGPQAVQALRAGKHVYSAVPTPGSVEEIAALVRAVEETGRVYMTGETSYYYPAVLYCRERFREGDFGRMVYGEAEYYHDWDHGLYEVSSGAAGSAGGSSPAAPPMYYPTHSISMIVSVTGAHMTHVSCHGLVDQGTDDGIYGAGANVSATSSATRPRCSRCRTAAPRINEFRRIGHPGTVRMSLFGTEGSFEQNMAGAVWLTKDRNAAQRLDEELAVGGVRTPGTRSPASPRCTRWSGCRGSSPGSRTGTGLAPVPGGRLRAGVRGGEQPPNDVWRRRATACRAWSRTSPPGGAGSCWRSRTSAPAPRSSRRIEPARSVARDGGIRPTASRAAGSPSRRRPGSASAPARSRLGPSPRPSRSLPSSRSVDRSRRAPTPRAAPPTPLRLLRKYKFVLVLRQGGGDAQAGLVVSLR